MDIEGESDDDGKCEEEEGEEFVGGIRGFTALNELELNQLNSSRDNFFAYYTRDFYSDLMKGTSAGESKRTADERLSSDFPESDQTRKTLIAKRRRKNVHESK